MWVQDDIIPFILAMGDSSECNIEIIPLQFQGYFPNSTYFPGMLPLPQARFVLQDPSISITL